MAWSTSRFSGSNRAAIGIAKSFLSHLIQEKSGRRLFFDAIERLVQIATNRRLTGVMLDYHIDVLSAIPIEQIDHVTFRTQRLPETCLHLDRFNAPG